MTPTLRRMVLGALLVGALALTGCGGGTPSPNAWPGLTLAGDKVYIAFNQDVYGVDLAAQRELWRFTASGDTFYGAPALKENLAVVGGYSLGNAYGLDVTAGTQRWVFQPNPGNVVPGLDLLKNPNGNALAGAALNGGLAYFGLNTGYLYAVNLSSGTQAWEFRTEDRSGFWSRPHYENGTLYATSLGHKLYALDAATGKVLWEFDAGAPLAGDLTLVSGLAILGTFDSRVIAVDLGTTPPSLRWEHKVDNGVWGIPQVYDSTVYAATLGGSVYALELSDGTEVWHRALQGNPSVRAPVLVTASGVYVAVQDGRLYALKREDGSDLWPPVQLEANIQLLSQPLLWGTDKVLVAPMGSDSVLHVRSASNGGEVWVFKPQPQQ